MTAQAGPPTLRPNKGFHPILEGTNPHLFIDACMQSWPDADHANAHRHGVAAYAVTVIHPHESLEGAIEAIMFWHLMARKYPNLSIATSADHIREAHRDGRAAIIIAAQDGDWIGLHLHRIEAAYRLGLRLMLPVYNASNHIGGGCLDHADTGLTRFGETGVDECSRLGLLLDGSHVGKRTTLEMMDRATRPFVFSHSNVKAIVDNPRNVDDEQIKRWRHEQLTVFGLMKDAHDVQLRRWLDQLIAQGHLIVDDGEYPTLALSEAGYALCKGAGEVRLDAPAPPRERKRKGKRGAAAAATVAAPADANLFERLRALRKQLAEKAGLPPYVIATDAGLRAVCELKPKSVEGLALCHGWGEKRAARYGAQVIALVSG